MKSTKYLEGLQERLAEINSELAAVQSLIDERADIERLLARHVMSEQHQPKPPPELPLRAVTNRHSFQADPNSRASRVLVESRKVLEFAPKHDLPFLDLYHRLPGELNGSGKRREQARLTLIRSGKRAGIEYVDKNHVRLAL